MVDPGQGPSSGAAAAGSARCMELRRMGSEIRAKIAEIAPFMREQPPPPKEIEYRTAGEYILDQWRVGRPPDGDAWSPGRSTTVPRPTKPRRTRPV